MTTNTPDQTTALALLAYENEPSDIEVDEQYVTVFPDGRVWGPDIARDPRPADGPGFTRHHRVVPTPPTLAPLERPETWQDGDQEPDPVNQPSHYTSHPSGIEVIEITRHMDFLLGNVVKYVLRCDLKGKPVEDLEKAKRYLEYALEDRRKKIAAN